MLRKLHTAARPLTLLLFLGATPLVAQQSVQSTAAPTAPAQTPAPSTAQATTPAPQPSPLFTRQDDHPATIAAAKEENTKAMSRNHTVTYSTTVLILVIIILVLLI
jgi:hypothetical protein